MKLTRLICIRCLQWNNEAVIKCCIACDIAIIYARRVYGDVADGDASEEPVDQQRECPTVIHKFEHKAVLQRFLIVFAVLIIAGNG